MGERWTRVWSVGELRIEEVCGGPGDLSGWFLALEIARPSILKPDLLERINDGYSLCNTAGELSEITHGKSVEHVPEF